MATEKSLTVKTKLKAVLENAVGATQFIRTHAEMAMHVEGWAVELLPYRLEVMSFIRARGKDSNNFNDVVQYGSLYLTASDDFLRGEHIKADVELTKAEKRELTEELSDAFADDNMKDKMMTKAAAVGWMLYDILTPYIDQQLVEKVIQKKLLSIRLNLVSKFVTDEIEKTAGQLKKGAMIAERLEESGLVVNADDTVSCKTPQIQKIWDELQDPNHPDRKDDAFASDGDVHLEEELNKLNTPIAKMLLSCYNTVRL